MAVRSHLRLLLVAALVASGMLVLSPPAQASPTGAEQSSAVVTRLPLIHNAGRIFVQLHVVGTNTSGFRVFVFSGPGDWQAAPDVPIPALGIDCIGGRTVNLTYVCGGPKPHATTAPALPPGYYTVSLPAQRRGFYAGVVGYTEIIQAVTRPVPAPNNGNDPSDFFPVVDGTVGPRSNAETGVLNTNSYLGGRPARGDLAVTVTVVGGETVTALDIRMPAGVVWTLTRVSGAGNLSCVLSAAPPGQAEVGDRIHCMRLIGGVVSPFPVGVFTAVLVVSGRKEALSEVETLVQVGVGTEAVPTVQDSAPWIVI